MSFLSSSELLLTHWTYTSKDSLKAIRDIKKTDIDRGPRYLCYHHLSGISTTVLQESMHEQAVHCEKLKQCLSIPIQETPHLNDF